jgi:hypothetical protein
MNQSTQLTLTILKDNFDFEVTDMGDFWIAEKAEIKLIQPKSEILSCHFPFQIATDDEITLLFITEVNTVQDLQYLARLTDNLLLFTM